MKCFGFYNGEKKKEESKTPKTNSVRPFTGSEIRKSRLKPNSHDRPSAGAESRGHNQFQNLADKQSNLKNLADKQSNLKVYTLSEMKQITRNFSNSAKLGEGGFGCVFKGVIKSSEDPAKKIDVAIKQLGKRGQQGHKEWITEVDLLGVVDHPNLVKLIGYCAEDDERGIQRLLIYEYMPNGSVEDHLTRSSTPLPWDMRLRVALDAACGLTYLHEEMDFQIIFRDFKSSNILLDENWNAKLSDFGLARLGPQEGLTHVSTAVVGTMGYAAPEYIRTGHLTSKNDVWSYGVFLYELITGRRPLERNLPRNEQKLLEWIKPYLSDAKKFQQILDPRLERKQIQKSAHRLSLIANRCLVRAQKTRPLMSEIREMIREVVEASADTSYPRPPLTYKEPMESTKEREGKGKNRIIDFKIGDGARLAHKLVKR